MAPNTDKRQIIKAMAVIRRRIRDNPDRRVLWRPADEVSPPLYPAGRPELIATQLS